MSFELIAGVIALIVTLLGGGLGWQQVRAHGAETERRKRAEEDLNEIEDLLEEASKAPASREEAARILANLNHLISGRVRKTRKRDL